MHRLPEEAGVWDPEDSACTADPPEYMVAEEHHLSMHLPPLWPNPGMLSELPSIAPPLLLESPGSHIWGESPNSPVAL
jgi:hypothetical protein